MSDELEPIEEGEIEVVEAAPAPEPPPKKKSGLASKIGKGVTLANFIIAILFLTIAFFFHANKIQVDEKRRELDGEVRKLTQLQTERQQVVDALNQEIEQENQALARVQQEGQDTIGKLESAVKQTTDRIEEARKEQARLNEDSGKLHQQQEELIANVRQLREQYEDTRGQEEALVMDKDYLSDQLAKTLNDLREAQRRSTELANRLTQLENPAGQ